MPRTAPAPRGRALAGLLATVGLVAAASLAGVVVASPAAASPATDLAARVDAALSGSGASVAVHVDVDGLGVVLRREGGHWLPPASTQKSFVSAAALTRLGTSTRFRTEVVRTATPSATGLLRGDLWVVAGGDPYLTTSGLRALARSVKAAGITHVTGVLHLDDSRYDGRRNADGWEQAWVPTESGPLSALAVDANRWRRDSAFLRDPAVPNAVRLRDLMRAEGIHIGTVTRERRPAQAVAVASVVSGPMSAVTRRLLKDSDNFAAELLLKEVGHVVLGAGTSRGGLDATRQLLAPLGVKVGAGADGSGLSTLDRQNPDSQVQLLRAMETGPAAAAFRASLPVACVDGTLQRRLCGTAAAGRLVAKTGTVTGVRALAGWTTTRSGRTVRFGIQLTQVRDGVRAVAAIDRAVALLAASDA